MLFNCRGRRIQPKTSKGGNKDASSAFSGNLPRDTGGAASPGDISSTAGAAPARAELRRASVDQPDTDSETFASMVVVFFGPRSLVCVSQYDGTQVLLANETFRKFASVALL